MATELNRTPGRTASASERRRARQRRDARRSILDATEALLVENGYQAFSMRRLADRCGYTAPTIYHHFRDKSGLIDALLEERFRELLERLSELPRGGDPVEALRAQLETFVRFGLDNPTHYRLFQVPRPEATPPPSAERARELCEEPLQALAAQGRLATADIELAIQAIWVTLHGLLAMRVTRPDQAWSPFLESFTVEMLLRGLLRPARAGGGRTPS